jgi:hypothetical protein
MKGSQKGTLGQCPHLGNVRVIVKSAHYRPGALRAFNAREGCISSALNAGGPYIRGFCHTWSGGLL